MARYFLFRALGIIPMVLLSVFIVFWLGYMAPGDPITKMYQNDENIGSLSSQESIERMKEKYGLNRPFWVRYADYMGKLLHGDFGESIVQGGLPILPTIRRVLPISLQMGVWAVLILVTLGIPLGVIAALRHNSWLDFLIVGSSIALHSVPVFVTAPLVMLILVVYLKVMAVPYGWSGMFSTKIILPALFLGLGPLAGIIRQTRTGILEVLSNDYVRTARAKGLPEKMVIVRHILRTGLVPVTTTLGMTVTGLLTGSLFIDKIFGIPGFGRLSVDALTSLDYPMMLGTTIVGATMVMIANAVTDFIYPFLDPRVVYK
jgi:peptide/nickel transport system permease protein